MNAIETVPISSLMLDPANARRHPTKNLEALKASLARFGQQKPVVVDARGRVIAGNGTLTAARALGWSEIRVVRTALEGAEAAAFGVADNRTAELAEWDDDALERILRELELQRFDVSLLGFDMRDFAPQVPAVERGPVVMPEAVITEPGDLWKLGESRLLCGDATVCEDVTKLLAGERASLMFTDPPYGVNYGDSNKQNAIRGDMTQAEIPISFALAVEIALDDNARVYVCGGSTNFVMYWKIWDRYLHLQPRVLVWVKENFVLRHNNYHSQFELVYFGWKGKGGDPSFWYGDRKQADVLSIARDKEPLHPTQKPVALVDVAVRNSSAPGDVVFEPFAGSGSTLIAATAARRRCFALEIEPRWCDAIVRRYQALTQYQAENLTRPGVRVPMEDGSLFAKPEAAT